MEARSSAASPPSPPFASPSGESSSISPLSYFSAAESNRPSDSREGCPAGCVTATTTAAAASAATGTPTRARVRDALAQLIALPVLLTVWPEHCASRCDAQSMGNGDESVGPDPRPGGSGMTAKPRWGEGLGGADGYRLPA